MKIMIRVLLVSIGLCLPLVGEEVTAENIRIQSGETIAFLGDSITAGGKRPGGYCQLVLAGLKNVGIEVNAVFAGVSGHKSNQMLARLERDVISKNPDWMTLSCGVNDVWHGARGVALDDYVKNIEQIIDQAQAAGIQVMVLTSTMIKEDQGNELNQKLVAYNDALRELAAKKGCLLADLNQEMQDALKIFPDDAPKGKQLTRDGVHMNPLGNFMMAQGILKAFGVPEEKIIIPQDKDQRFQNICRDIVLDQRKFSVSESLVDDEPQN
jgi:lysophospholipase L1-like esterase